MGTPALSNLDFCLPFRQRMPVSMFCSESATKRVLPEVCHGIIADYQRTWKKEPKESIENVVPNIFCLKNADAQNDNSPCQN